MLFPKLPCRRTVCRKLYCGTRAYSTFTGSIFVFSFFMHLIQTNIIKAIKVKKESQILLGNMPKICYRLQHCDPHLPRLPAVHLTWGKCSPWRGVADADAGWCLWPLVADARTRPPAAPWRDYCCSTWACRTSFCCCGRRGARGASLRRRRSLASLQGTASRSAPRSCSRVFTKAYSSHFFKLSAKRPSAITNMYNSSGFFDDLVRMKSSHSCCSMLKL